MKKHDLNCNVEPFFPLKRLIQDKKMDLVINLPNQKTKHLKDNYLIRRSAIDATVPLLTNFEVNYSENGFAFKIVACQMILGKLM